jgi:hypothetical protein
MFRQFRIVDDEKRFLRIFYRSSVNDPLEEYQMETVTYGTSAAPFLANRTIRQIALDNAPDDETRNAIFDCVYVDDFVCGGFSIPITRALVNNVDRLS